MANPFPPASSNYIDYETLSDLQWHCTICELKAAQAKTWQTWRDAHGIQFDKARPDSQNYSKTMRCETCDRNTVHRKLLSLEFLETTSARANISAKLAARVKKLLGNEEAFWVRTMEPKLLEVDHKFPQIRWNTDEESSEAASDEGLIAKFMLLTRSNNLLKSRNCERCFHTNQRGKFPGIEYWYEGDGLWRTDPHDERGCVGCFWYDPYKWREELNNLVLDSENT